MLLPPQLSLAALASGLECRPTQLVWGWLKRVPPVGQEGEGCLLRLGCVSPSIDAGLAIEIEENVCLF